MGDEMNREMGRTALQVKCLRIYKECRVIGMVPGGTFIRQRVTLDGKMVEEDFVWPPR